MLLLRTHFSRKYTASQLILENALLFTIECPWIPSPTMYGGTPFKSCVPNGIYELHSFTRSNGKPAIALYAPHLNVYITKRPNARFANLFHVGNFPRDTEGCILPGLSHSHGAVWNSIPAMEKLLEAFKQGDTHLEIRSYSTFEILDEEESYIIV